MCGDRSLISETQAEVDQTDISVNGHGDAKEPGDEKPHRAAKIGLTVATTALGLLAVGTAPFLRRFTGAPYVSSSVAARRAISDRLKRHVHPGGHVIDLGSGSGEILLDAARHGFRATGYELNLWLVALSRWKAWRNGLGGKVHFVWADMWKADIGHADAIVVFGIPDIMSRVQHKIVSECAHGCLVCCNTFPIDGLQQQLVRKQAGVSFYITSSMSNLSTAELANDSAKLRDRKEGGKLEFPTSPHS